MNLIKVISNALENNRFETEDKLDKILNNKDSSIEYKKDKAIELLREVALAEISHNLWQTYITPKDSPDNGANTPDQGPQQNPEA